MSTIASDEAALAGVLHIFVAFDWGDEVELDHARRLLPAETHALPRRRRTPTSIAFRPPPLRFALNPVALDLPELGPIQAQAEATVFDFAAVSVGLHVPFRLPADTLAQLAGYLADPPGLVKAAHTALEPLHRTLLPAIRDPHWKDDLSEEYFVFHLPPGEPFTPDQLLSQAGSWLAGLLRLEVSALSRSEIEEALRLFLSYSPQDLFIADWAAAVLLDRDCDETLQVVEFANLQLLEFRHIDQRLDDNLGTAYERIHRVAHARLPLWYSQHRALRALGEMKVEANGLFERTGNVLKLVGDPYLARVYRLVATRLHLEDWERDIQRKLEVAEGVYQVMSDQSVTYRMELLEIIVIVLIALEIVLAFFRH